MNRRMWGRLAATLLLACLAAQSAQARVEREDIIVLGADGLQYTSYKTLRSDLAERVLYLGPDEAPEDAVFIVPSEYEATPLDDGGTRLHFKSGSFALMYTGVFDSEVERQPNGVRVFSSWDGVTRSDGHLGKWNAPDDFASFSYTWVVPRNIEILAYEANREGTWERRENTLNWTGKQVNDIAFTIRYRVAEPTPAATSAQAQAPQTPQPPSKPAPQGVPAQGIPLRREPGTGFDPLNGLRVEPRAGFAPNMAPARAPAAKPAPETEPVAPEPAQAPASSSDVDPAPREVTLDGVVTLGADGRPQITKDGKTRLRRLADRLSVAATQRVVVTGPDFQESRDTGGSVAQAARVSDYLDGHGVNGDLIDIRAGAQRAEASGRTVTITVEPGGLLEGYSANP